MSPDAQRRLVSLAAAALEELRICQQIAHATGGDLDGYDWEDNKQIRHDIDRLLIEITVEHYAIITQKQDRQPPSPGCNIGTGAGRADAPAVREHSGAGEPTEEVPQ